MGRLHGAFERGVRREIEMASSPVCFCSIVSYAK